MALIAGSEASVYLMDNYHQTPAAFTDEDTTANEDRTIYHITNRAKRWWKPDAPVTVTVAPTQVVPKAIIHAGGGVVFDSPLESGSTVTVTGQYFTATNKIAGAKSWGFDPAIDMLDITSWDSPKGWKEFMPTLAGGSVNVERWWLDQLFLLYITERCLTGLELRVTDEEVYYAYGYLTGDSIKRAVEGAIEESINWQISGAVQYL